MNKIFDKIEILKLEKEDINHLSALTPDGWNDFYLVFHLHFNRDYFFPIKLVFENKIIGVAELIVNKNIGWLGNIVVDKAFRNQGFGKILTQRLIEMANQKKCDSIYLLATPLGKYVYQKLGFKENGKYIFYKTSEKITSTKIDHNILPYQPKYQEAIFQLDQEAMGEDRSKVLSHFLKDGWVYKKENEEKINGFFLPTLTNALIICNNQHAGLELIKKREAMGQNIISIPEQCHSTIQFLQQRGYKEYRQATFMFLGKMKTWNPQMVFSRIGGYLG